jgi:hypothetical protein
MENEFALDPSLHLIDPSQQLTVLLIVICMVIALVGAVLR